ncbi:Alkaline ceramidase 3 [Gryganskiella cystojenkinii]|nr:Alkaline ceramidase 3 [Gryganskiella cystojenkinii]
MGPNDLQGYWGPATSSIDWCEDNYVISYYIAEFFNSLSSFAMIILGEAACYNVGLLEAAMAKSYPTKTTNLFRYKLAFRTITVVGIGSILFHGTLLHHMQMLDEVPMLYSVIVLFFCLIESRFGPQPAWFPYLLTLHGVVVTCLVAFTEGNIQFYSFHGSFGSLEITTLYLIYQVYRARKRDYKDVKRVFETGIAMYAIAVAVWATDLSFCETPLVPSWPWSSVEGGQKEGHGTHDSDPWIVKHLYFHAWWHILVSLGLYMLSTVIMLDGLIVQGWQPKIEWRGGGLLPIATIVGSDPEKKGK